MKRLAFFFKTWLPVILVAGFIFMMSNFAAADSDNQSGLIINILRSIFPGIESTHALVTIVRKAAHFTEYLIFGFLTARAMKKSKFNLWFALPACILYATSDEIHQSFIPGRSCEAGDVLIDALGAAIGVTIYFLLFGRKNKR